MLDKNPNQILDDNLKQMKNKFSDKNPNFLLCSKPFLKADFLKKIIDSSSIPTIFFDFDLMHSGYIVSGIITKNDNVTVFRGSSFSWEKDLTDVIKKISKEKILVILDSLNGIYNSFDDLESTRFVNAVIMLLSSVARYSNSQILITAMTIKNDNGNWVLSPGGRHLIESKDSAVYYLGVS